MREIEERIKLINKTQKNAISYFLNGGCYIFAQKLKEQCGGNIYYLKDYQHFVLQVDGKLYDTTGNVTKRYADADTLTEEEVLKRNKIMTGIRKAS